MKITITVTHCDYHGRSGFSANGWAGETPKEAVLEYFLCELKLSDGEAWDRLENTAIAID